MKRAMALLAAIPAAAFAQGMTTQVRGGGGSMSADGSRWSSTARLAAAISIPAAVTGQPYSGDEVREIVRTLQDGSRTTNKTVEQRVFRDSQGRTRVERPITIWRSPAPVTPMPPIVEISDPVAGRVCDLDTQNRVAHCSETHAKPGGAASARGGIGLAQSQTMEIVDGVDTVVISSQRVISGRAQGYDRDIVQVKQTWFSPELGIVMQEKTSDPLNGENTFRIENFSRVEPSFVLFQIPADYTLQMETGSFTITYSK